MKTLKRGFFLRLMSVVLTLMMVFSVLSVGIISTSAAEVNLAETGATITGGMVLYLKVNQNWKTDNARFAVYFCNGSSSSVWVDMEAVSGETDIYSVTVPSGGSHANVIFCRMNPANSTNNWDNRWNQTGDLVYDGTNNLFTISGWESGSWSTYNGGGSGSATDGDFSVDVTAPETVLASKNIVINATSDAEEEVTYNLYLTGDTKELIDTNTTGTFTVPTTLADGGKSFRFTVEASVTVDGETYTDEKVVDVSVTEFELKLNVSAPETVEAGMILTIKATAEADTEVVYEFYTGDGTLLVNNTSGIYTEEITVDDIGTKTYYVIAKTTVEGKVFTAETELLTVAVTAVKEAYDVKICFKSADTLAYAPYITTEGAVDNLSSEKMTKGTFICKNATETASYYWYEADVQVSKAAPQLEITVVGSRYALEGYIHLNIAESGTIYLALENINFTRGNELQNLTSWDETERNWTMSAANMIYDDGVDKADFAEVAARIDLRTVGDANDDGAVNIKDATAIQKHLAEIVTLDSLAVEISDINSDGKVTVKDATAIQKKLVALL